MTFYPHICIVNCRLYNYLYILLINKMNNAKLLHLMVYILTIILGWACTEVDITMPKGPKGDRGMSAYEFWKENVENGVISWPKQETEITDFLST